MSETQAQGMEVQEMTLIDLVLLAQNGDRDAFGVLFKRYRGLVYNICLKRLGDPYEAEELLQMVFLQVLEKLSHLRDPEAFVGWLRAIANRMAINRVVRDRKPVGFFVDLDLDELPHADGSPVVQGQDNERDLLVQMGLSHLRESGQEISARLAQLLIERYFEDKSERELKDAHPELPIGTIKQNLHTGRERLRRILMKLGLGPEDGDL